jgi:hypothetical protein
MQNIATIHVRSSRFIVGMSANLTEGMMQSRLWINGKKCRMADFFPPLSNRWPIKALGETD